MLLTVEKCLGNSEEELTSCIVSSRGLRTHFPVRRAINGTYWVAGRRKMATTFLYLQCPKLLIATQ